MTVNVEEYARALFMLSLEENSSDEFLKSVTKIEEIFKNYTRYLELLSSPVITIDEKSELIDEAFSKNTNNYVVSFLKLLCKKGHIKDFSKCAREFDKLYKVLNNITTARVVSATKLCEVEKSELIKKLQKLFKKTVELELSVDSSILGGLIISIEDKVIDRSLRNSLFGIKDVIGK